MTYSLIITIFNEERTLPELIKRLNNLNDKKIEIIIMNDGSNDSTNFILNKNNKFIIKRNKINRGKGYSIIKGLDFATKNNVILMDGDLEVDINEIPALIKKYESSKSDVLAGVRWGNKGNNQYSDINMVGNFIINSIFNLLFKTNFNDVLCCVKILNLKKFKSLNVQSQGFSIEIETMAKMVLNGYSIKEVPIKYNRRTTKEGKKLKFSDSWNIIWTMLILKFKNN